MISVQRLLAQMVLPKARKTSGALRLALSRKKR